MGSQRSSCAVSAFSRCASEGTANRQTGRRADEFVAERLANGSVRRCASGWLAGTHRHQPDDGAQDALRMTLHRLPRSGEDDAARMALERCGAGPEGLAVTPASGKTHPQAA